MIKAKQPAAQTTPPRPRRPQIPRHQLSRAQFIEDAFRCYPASDNLNLLSTLLFELSDATGIHVDHPTIVRTFYKEAIHALHTQQGNAPDDAEVTTQLLDEIATVSNVIFASHGRNNRGRHDELATIFARHGHTPTNKTSPFAREVARLSAEREADDDNDRDDDVDSTPGDTANLAPVVDLNCWRQAQARPIRNLLFSAQPESEVTQL